MNKLVTIFGTILFLSATGWSQNSFTLQEAKEYALKNSLTIKNSEYEIDVMNQKYIEVRGMGLPQVQINGTFNNFLNLPVSVIDAQFFNPNATPGDLISFRAGTEYSATGSLEVGQLLFNGSYIIGLKVAKYLKSFQASSSNIEKEDVIFNVIQSYEMVAVAKENQQFVDSMVLITEKLIEKQKNYLELGLMQQEDMDQLSYSLLTAKDAQLSAKIQYENALSALKLTMGYPMENQLSISENAEKLMNQSTLSTPGDITNNRTYQLLEQQVVLSEYNVRNNEFANLPSLNAFFQHSYNAYRNEFDFFQDKQWFAQTVWGLKLNIPIFSGLSRHAVTTQSRIKLLQDQNAVKQMEQTLKFQSAQAQNNLSNAQSKFKLQQENISLARNIYNNAITKKDIGEGNSIIVTQKYNQLMVAQAQYVGSLVDVFQARLALDKIYNKLLPTE
ncbi:MAG: TolC family protein [Crocinitomicaceae bacterium]|nr:TolC family protein [Crocinitomicaceae bacterium]